MKSGLSSQGGSAEIDKKTIRKIVEPIVEASILTRIYANMLLDYYFSGVSKVFLRVHPTYSQPYMLGASSYLQTPWGEDVHEYNSTNWGD